MMATHYVTYNGTDSWANSVSSLTPCSLTTAVGTATVGDIIAVKYDAANPYSTTTVLTCANAGSSSGSIQLQGYDSTPGDNTGNRPTITSSTSSCNLLSVKSGWIVDNLLFTHTGSTRGNAISLLIANGMLHVKNCVIDGCAIGVYAANIGAACTGTGSIVGCEIKNCTGDGIQTCSLECSGNYIHNNGGAGITIGIGGATSIAIILGNFIASNTGNGIKWAVGAVLQYIHIKGNTLRTNTGAPILMSSVTGSYFLSLENNIIWGNNGAYYGANFSGGVVTVITNRNNAYGNNGSGNVTGIAAGTNDVTLTGDPVTATTAVLNSTAGAGLACQNVGWPGASLFGVGYADIGALQHTASGGSTGPRPVPNIHGGFA